MAFDHPQQPLVTLGGRLSTTLAFDHPWQPPFCVGDQSWQLAQETSYIQPACDMEMAFGTQAYNLVTVTARESWHFTQSLSSSTDLVTGT